MRVIYEGVRERHPLRPAVSALGGWQATGHSDLAHFDLYTAGVIPAGYPLRASSNQNSLVSPSFQIRFTNRPMKSADRRVAGRNRGVHHTAS